MDIDEANIFENWPDKVVVLPKRSRLYNLEPVTHPWNESLTSYIQRLALAHSLTIKDLLGKEICLNLNSQYYVKNGIKALGNIFRNSGTLNSNSPTTKDFIHTLEKLTGFSGLQNLTSLKWQNVLSPIGLHRDLKVWCPKCLEEWKRNKHPLYEPLVWSFQVVKICSKHNAFLHFTCPYTDCGLYNLQLSWNSNVGYCSHCDRWLGSKEENGNVLDEVLKLHKWVLNNIEDLCQMSLKIENHLSGTLISNQFQIILSSLTNGIKTRLSNLLGITEGSIRKYLKGSLPNISILLMICYILDIPLSKFITEELDHTCSIVNNISGFERKFFLSLIDVSKQNYKRMDKQFVGIKLQETIQSDSEPPNLREVAKSLGYHTDSLRRNFPQECRDISRKHILFKKEKVLRNDMMISEIIEDTTLKYISVGSYPSLDLISKELPDPNHKRNPKYVKVRNDLLKLHGITIGKKRMSL